MVNYNLSNIRALFNEGFTDEELRRLCYDVPDFRPVYDQIAQNTGKTKIIDLLIEHADRKLQIETLLALAKKYNPARYEKHKPYDDAFYSEPNTLYIISDTPGIKRFDRIGPQTLYRSRPGSEREGDRVGAVDRDHLHNYLLPLDCPRVTFYALPYSSPEDVERLMGLSTAKYVVAIEARWLPKFQHTHLYQYEVPGDTFTLTDAGAGHYGSDVPVLPRVETRIDDLLSTLLAHDVELRVMPSLWKLYDAVVASTLQYSMIRMRNAFQR